MCGTGCINVNHRNVFVEIQNDKCKIKKNTLDHIYTQIFLYEKGCELLEKTIHYVSPLLKGKASKECMRFIDGIHEGAHYFHQACHASFFIYDALSFIQYIFKKKQNKQIEAIDINTINSKETIVVDITKQKTFSEKLLKKVIIVTRAASHGLYMIKFLQELKIINFPIKAPSKYIQILNVINFSAQTVVFFNKIAPKFHDKDNKKDFIHKLHFSHLMIKTTGLISSTVSVISKLEYFNEYNYLLKPIKKTNGLLNTIFVFWNVVPKSQESYTIKNISVTKKTDINLCEKKGKINIKDPENYI